MRLAALFRWLARLGATAVTGLFITFLVRDGNIDVRELTDAELGGFGALLLMVVGTLLGWRMDLTGGILLLAGYAVFSVLEAGNPPLPFHVYGAAGLLLLLAGIIRVFYVWRHLRAKAAPNPAPAPSPVPSPTPRQSP